MRYLGDLPSNPVNKVEKPKLLPKEMKIWNLEQINFFLEYAKDHRLYFIFHLAIMTGLRKDEILGLRWKDVDLKKQVLYVNQTLEPDGKTIKLGAKTRSCVRSVTLSQSAKKVLLKYKKEQDTEKEFFTSEYNDLDLVVCAQNEPMKLIAERLGHSKISTTIDTYGHLLPNMQHDASIRLEQTIFGDS